MRRHAVINGLWVVFIIHIVNELKIHGASIKSQPGKQKRWKLGGAIHARVSFQDSNLCPSGF